MRRTLMVTLVAFVLATAGCDAKPAGSAPASPGPGSPAASSYASARAELAAGLVRTAAVPSAYTVETAEESGAVIGTMTGVSDPAREASSGRIEVRSPVVGKLETTVIGDDVYSRGNARALTADHWTHLSLARAPLVAAIGFPGIVATVGSAGALADVARTGPGTFTGHLNPSKVSRTSLLYGWHEQVSFEATLDGQGYITSLVLHTSPAVDGMGMKPERITIRLSEFGTPVTVAAPPPAEVKEAGDEAYALYGDVSMAPPSGTGPS
ncbi:hypothetical protein [Dactylosporangium sp. CS-033363]|uniref:hypothetical protein n=1 Tax=Dactylosporangium sp. CS-033363 TaxID=3239935 RepID=UPI003D8F63F1